MKKILLIIILIFSANAVYSQTYMDTVTKKICDCLSQIKDTVQDQKDIDAVFGLCVVQAAIPYRDQISKDYGISFDKPDKDHSVYKKLGEILSIQLMAKCPDAFLKLIKKSESFKTAYNRSQNYSEENVSQSLTGTVTKIEKENFVVITMKMENGKSVKFFWLTFVESNVELVEVYKDLVGKTVKISYQSNEFFDPKLEEYRDFMVMDKLEVIK